LPIVLSVNSTFCFTRNPHRHHHYSYNPSRLHFSL